MPRRPLQDVIITDSSVLARNMYQLLFSSQNRFRVRFVEEYETLFKRSPRLRPDLMIVNSNSLAENQPLRFPCPAILVISRNRFDIKENTVGLDRVLVIEKPFYPYDLLAMAHKLIQEPAKKRTRKRKKNV